jgi:GNAT superfamily N-acetyltransferase
MTVTDQHIRRATREDVAQILRFIVELAVYEREPDAVRADERMLEEALFCDRPRVFALICEQAGEPVGFALYFYNFSTWLGRHGIYLEDLYVTPQARGSGAGKALLREIARIAVAEGCGRFDWSVLKWNTPSIAFYEACGAWALDDWVGYRLEGDALARFGAGGD